VKHLDQTKVKTISLQSTDGLQRGQEVDDLGKQIEVPVGQEVLGNLFNVIVKSKIPVRYITNGQIIPDDIVAAEPEHLANMIYTGAYSEA
ncbi:MAG: hypothetical protein WCJ10_04980, partial [Opitutaceae bacterium]